MIIGTQSLPVERYGDVGEESQFTIRASAKAFKILSDSMYSNKVLAVIREYYCNAVDAHNAVGKENVPVEIHLPNFKEPTFSVKDYGTGLSHEDVMHMYSTYFESTKNRSNKDIGGLGIGGKAFFAINDAFMITSRFNGMKRIYSAFINEHDLPSITLMSEEETEETNGLEVAGAIKNSDWAAFTTTAEKFFARAKVQPIVTGGYSGDFASTKINYHDQLEGKNWRIRLTNIDSGAQAIMGCVAYPIATDRNNLSKEEYLVSILPIDITFGIGDLDVAPSRESLSFNKATLDKAKEVLSSIHAEIVAIFESKIKDCKNLWEAKCLMAEVSSGPLNIVSSIINSTTVTWKGSPVTISPFKLTCIGQSSMLYFDKPNYKGQVKKNEVVAILPRKETQIYINDLGMGTISRVRHLARESDKGVYVITLGSTSEAALIKDLGMEGATLPKVSALPKPPRSASVLSDLGRAKVLELDLNAAKKGCLANDCWDPADEEFDIAEGGIYVCTDKYQIDGDRPSYFYKEYIAPLEMLGVDISTLQVFGFKNRVIDKARNNPKWKRFSEFVKEKAIEKLKNPKLTDQLVNYNAMQKVSEVNGIRDFVEIVRDIVAPVSNLGRAILKYTSMRREAEKLQNIQVIYNLARQYGVDLDSSNSVDLVTEFTSVLTDYPMLKLVLETIGDGGWSTVAVVKNNKAILADYIKSIENKQTI